VYSDGFVHAGNLAYMSLVTLFPFFIVAAAVARLFGQTGEGLHTVEAFLHTVPPASANVLQTPTSRCARRAFRIFCCGSARIVGLWTTASFTKTIRDILRRAYGVKSVRPFWHYRLWSIGLILASMILILSRSLQIMLLRGRTVHSAGALPMRLSHGDGGVAQPARARHPLFAALYMVFYTLTPRKYRESKCPEMAGTRSSPRPVVAGDGASPAHPVESGQLRPDLWQPCRRDDLADLLFFVGLGLVVGAE